MALKIHKLKTGIAFLCLFFSTAGLTATAQYTYDPLNRLIRVQYDDGAAIDYTYDAAGNRLVRQVTGSPQGAIPGQGLLAQDYKSADEPGAVRPEGAPPAKSMP